MEAPLVVRPLTAEERRRRRAWLRAYNRRVKREGSVRILACALPTKNPWLNRIEPYWAASG
jgi:hypothetical protein